MMREKLKLFLTYIEFFHKLHTKYLQRFSNKIQLMNTHINDDIKFDETVKIKTNNLTESKGIDTSSLLLSPRMNNVSQKSPGFLQKSMESVNSLFSVSKNSENSSINLVIVEDKSLETETISQEKIDTAFSNIDSICNNVINNSNDKNENKIFDKFFENPINDYEVYHDNAVENVEINTASLIEDIVKKYEIKAPVVEEVIEINSPVVIEEVVKNEEDFHNDDMSVLSLDSAIGEEEDKNKKEKEEPKKKRTYKPRKKN
jgi:hypothetical protein